ncbi:GNAT family N-acetyltransferase [Nocardioides houyundeii]|uniref:GNAT family N-acetyltransferase n=1 Tax=Nocardioides houyundeii TaxID=2045452 RepID=UPI003B830291
MSDLRPAGRIQRADLALAAMRAGHEEVKSMRTEPRCRGRGVARQLLEHLLRDARLPELSAVRVLPGGPEQRLHDEAPVVAVGRRHPNRASAPVRRFGGQRRHPEGASAPQGGPRRRIPRRLRRPAGGRPPARVR